MFLQYLPGMKKLFLAPLLLIISVGIIHAQNKTKHKHRTSKADPSARKTIIKYGVASYYANKFEGRRTASGEIFISTKYTAACNRLPLNTWIKVTNLRNNKSVIVRVNDRLHPKNKRLVDLSKTSAKKLGYYGRGITKVKVEVLENYHP
jgi:rare lipoprotein A